MHFLKRQRTRDNYICWAPFAQIDNKFIFTSTSLSCSICLCLHPTKPRNSPSSRLGPTTVSRVLLPREKATRATIDRRSIGQIHPIRPRGQTSSESMEEAVSMQAWNSHYDAQREFNRRRHSRVSESALFSRARAQRAPCLWGSLLSNTCSFFLLPKMCCDFFFNPPDMFACASVSPLPPRPPRAPLPSPRRLPEHPQVCTETMMKTFRCMKSEFLWGVLVFFCSNVYFGSSFVVGFFLSWNQCAVRLVAENEKRGSWFWNGTTAFRCDSYPPPS